MDAFTIKSQLLSSVVSLFYSFFPFSFSTASFRLLISEPELHGYGTLFLLQIQSASSYPSLVLILTGITVLMGVSTGTGTICSFFLYLHAFMKQTHKKCKERQRDTKSIERRQPGADYEAPAREELVSEWQVAWPQGLLMKRVCLPAYRSSYISWSDACLTGRLRGALMGTWGHTHTHPEDGNLVLNRCVLASMGMVMFVLRECWRKYRGESFVT